MNFRRQSAKLKNLCFAFKRIDLEIGEGESCCLRLRTVLCLGGRQPRWWKNLRSSTVFLPCFSCWFRENDLSSLFLSSLSGAASAAAKVWDDGTRRRNR